MHVLASDFLFSIPPNATPSFRTPMVSLQWVLRFEFTIGSASAKGVWRTEQLTWALPLAVYPPRPSR